MGLMRFPWRKARTYSESSVSDDSEIISESQFEKAIIANGYSKPENSRLYHYFLENTKDYSREEAAMFLAQMIHESNGFQNREAKHIKSSAYNSDLDLPGKSYHGRGYIKLTWAYDYFVASKSLGLSDELLRNPDKVSDSIKYSMLVSAWYWKNRVRPVLKDSNKFGLTTKAINGYLECGKEYNERAANRYQTYRKVAKELKVKNVATDDGCYKIK